MSEECIFCRIVAGAAPANVVAETAAALAFMDRSQPTSGHVLVIPKQHIQDIYALDAENAAAVFQLAAQVARAVKAALRPDGISLLQANERAAHQSVFHLHVHIFARYENDRDRVRIGWQPQPVAPEELADLAERIRRAL